MKDRIMELSLDYYFSVYLGLVHRLQVFASGEIFFLAF